MADIQTMTEEEMSDRFYENLDAIKELEWFADPSESEQAKQSRLAEMISTLRAENIAIVQRTFDLHPEDYVKVSDGLYTLRERLQ